MGGAAGLAGAWTAGVVGGLAGFFGSFGAGAAADAWDSGPAADEGPEEGGAPPGFDGVPIDDNGAVCGGDQNKKDDRKRNRCIAACRHLLPDPQGDLQSSNFHRCVAECMAR